MAQVDGRSAAGCFALLIAHIKDRREKVSSVSMFQVSSNINPFIQATKRIQTNMNRKLHYKNTFRALHQSLLLVYYLCVCVCVCVCGIDKEEPFYRRLVAFVCHTKLRRK